MIDHCRLKIVTSALAIALGTQPAAAVGPKTRAHLKVMVLGPSETMPTTACNGKASGNALEFVIKDNILKIFTDGGYEGREVLLNGQPVPNPPTLDPKSKYIPTYYDMSVPLLTSGASWTQITIRVKKAASDGVNFLVPRDANGNFSPTDSSVAVLIPAGRSVNFCGRSAISINKGDQVIQFGVMFTGQDTTSMNIGLLVADKKHPGYFIPIYLDPNIKNPG